MKKASYSHHNYNEMNEGTIPSFPGRPRSRDKRWAGRNTRWSSPINRLRGTEGLAWSCSWDTFERTTGIHFRKPANAHIPTITRHALILNDTLVENFKLHPSHYPFYYTLVQPFIPEQQIYSTTSTRY